MQWGWHFFQVPVIVIYFALIVTSIILRLLPSASLREVEGRGFLIYGLTILLIRAIFVVHLPVQQLGLAIGICGWLLQSNHEGVASTSAISKVWEAVGITFLVLGWLFSAGEEVPWQATVVSFLALQFFGQRLRRDWTRLDLLAIYLIGLQGVFLIERLIPLSARQNILDFWFSFTQTQNYPYSIYSLVLFPYLLIFVLITDWLSRQYKPLLSSFGEQLCLILGIAMTAISLFNLTARSLNLFVCTILLVYISSRRNPIRFFPIYFTHIVGLLTIFSTLDWRFSSLNQVAWIKILLGLMVVEWAVSSLRKFRSNLTVIQVWCRSCWHIGFFFAFLSYILLWQQVELFLRTQESHTEELWWLLVPLTLTGVASRSRGKRRRQAAFWSCCGLIFAQTLILWLPDFRLFSLGFGAGLMLVNTYYLRRLVAARIQIGFTLALQSIWIGRLITTSFGQFFTSSEGIVSDAITLVLLWLLSLWLKHRQGFLANLYAKATENWAIFLCVFNLLSLTIDCLGATVGLFSLTWYSLVATFLIGAILIYRYWHDLNYWVVYGVVWILEILAIQSVILTVNLFSINSPDTASYIATVNIILAFFTLGCIGWLRAKSSRLSDLISLQILPLIVAMMGIGWRWGHFTAYTGLLMVGAGITGVMVGYRLNRSKIISYLAIAGISLGIYEWAIYQMGQIQGEVANNIMILALITAAIAITYRFFVWFLSVRGYHQYLHLHFRELKIIAHTHWGIGSLLKFISLLITLSTITLQSQINFIIFIASLILPSYSLIQGRNRSPESKNLWIYWGLLDLIVTAVFARLIWQQLEIFDSYQVVIACSLALTLYYLPWRSWGWNVTPWQQFALILPSLSSLVIFRSLTGFNYINFLIVATFYLQIAIAKKNIRWTYVSLFYFDFALLHWLYSNFGTEQFLYALVVGFSILYIAQVDQALKALRKRKSRHYWRIMGSGIICIISLVFYQEIGLIPAIISLLTLLIGLGLQIRAFLFVGTITFIATGIYQLIVVSFQYAFIKWLIGLIVGILLITVAANFERRRDQMFNLWQNWMNTLNQWQ